MATTKLTRAFGAGNRRTWTLSLWVKRSSLSGVQCIMAQQDGWQGNGNAGIYFESGKISTYNFGDNLNSGNSSKVGTKREFRDTNSWYHLVFRQDTTQGTASNRFRIYVNGVQETDLLYTNYPSQNVEPNFNRSTRQHGIGGHQTDNSYQFDGSMSHVHFCDGYSYDASSFGQTDTTTGEWKAKTSPSVNYGTTGFLILKDGNTITDQSSNSNDFTLGGGTLTDLKDNPDNVFATLNPLSPQSYTFSNGNNTIVRAGGTGQTTAIGTLAVNSGKWYWELKLNSGLSDYPRVGIYEMNSDNHIYTTHLGNASNGTGKWWGSGGASSSNKKIGDGNSSTIEFYPYENGDILMFALDCDNEKIWFGKNGTWYTNNNSTTTTGTAISNNTATPAFSNVSNSKLWIPAVFGNAGADNWSINFGNGYFGTTAVTSAGTNASDNGIFEYDVPTGYTALSTKGLNL